MKMLSVRKSLLLVAMLLCSSLSTFAQQAGGKKSILVDKFLNVAGTRDAYVSAYRSGVIAHIQERNRLLVIDAESEAALNQEQGRRQSANASAEGDMERLKVMSKLGANYILIGAINTITPKSTTKDGKTTWTAKCTYTVKIIDPTNGTTLASKTSDYDPLFTKQTEEEAILYTLQLAGSTKELDELIETVAPLEGTILEVNQAKKDEAKEVYISLGSANGVDTDTWFGVYVKRTIANRESLKKIGLLKVSAVEGDDLSLCKVKKGGKEIKSALDQKQEVVLKSEFVETMFGIRI